MSATAHLARSAIADPLGAMLTRMGRREQLAADHPITLTEGSGIWLVETGTLDVFAVEMDADGQAGKCHFICAVPAPGLLAHFPASSGDVMMLAVSRDASVVALDESQLAGIAAVEPVQPVLAQLLDHWLGALGAGLARFIALPPAPVPLALSTPITPPEGSVITSAQGVVWAYVGDGSARFMGQAPFTLTAGALIPITTQMGLIADAGAVLTGYCSQGLMRAPGCDVRLRQFHQLYLDCLRQVLE